MTTRTVALTGASGFVGAAVAARLAAIGWRVRALVHSRPLDDALLAAGVAPVSGSLSDQASLEALMDGADAVIHCAALVKAKRREDFDRVNRGGARTLFAAAQSAAPGAKLLFVSSLAARQPDLSEYAASKAAAEAELARTALDWDVIRPPAVYGPGDPETLKLLQWIAKGLAPVPAGPEAKVSVIHVQDLAEGVAAWAESGAPARAVYEVDDGHPGGRTWDEVVAQAAQALGARPRIVAAPRGLLIAGAGAYEGLARLLGRTPMVTAGKMREMCWPDWSCAPGAFGERHGWTPARDLQTGLRETVDWYRKAGWL